MAKTSVIYRDKKRRRMVANKASKRAELVALIKNKATDPQKRMEAVWALAKMPRNSAAVRLRNRCELTGRGQAVYRRFKLSRIKLRELGSQGLIPGLRKSSW